MYGRSLFISVALVLAGSACARADTIQQFSVSATGSDYIYVYVPATADVKAHYDKQPATGTLSVTGTYTVDTTTGMFLGGDVFVNVNGAVSELTYLKFSDVNVPSGMTAGGAYVGNPPDIGLISGTTVSFPFLEFGLAVPYSLVGYTGSALCSDTNQEGNCDTQGSGLTYATSYSDVYVQYVHGTLTPVVTPEPSGLALLGTGLLGVGAMARKRSIRSKAFA